MASPEEFTGGVYAAALPDGRAPAKITLGLNGIEATVASGDRFVVPFAEAQLELGGAGGAVLFCRNRDRSISIYSPDRELRHALAYNGLDPELAARAAQLLATASKKRWRDRTVFWGIAGAVLVFLCFLPMLFGWLVQSTVAALPHSVDEKMGQSAAESIAADVTLVEREVVADGLNRILARLRESVPPGFGEWKFRVRTIHEDSINAFALPGGQIFFHSGLLRRAESAEEIAGVMAHEMAHVLERHGLRRVGQSLGITAGVGLLMGDAGMLATVAAEYLTQATINSYSRADESAADAIAVELMHRAGLDPAALSTMFERMKDEGGELPSLLHWISTHPTHEARIAAIRELVARLPEAEAKPLAIDWAAVRAALPK